MALNVALMGGGSWGTTVASLISHNAPIKMWARSPVTVAEINDLQVNTKYLPGVSLPKSLKATGNIEDAAKGCDVLVMGIPSQNFRGVLESVKPHLRAWVPVVSLTKGLEHSSGKRMTELINEVLPGHPAGVLTGPNLAKEIMSGQAAASVLAMEDASLTAPLQKLFHSGLFRVYTNTDLLGCELGGVLKNIIAIAVGMSDGLGAGDNTRSALITRGLAEVTRLGVAMGGRQETFAGLAGMGDMIATCTSPLSRNRHVGVQLGKGRKLDDIIEEMVMVAEGVKSAPAIMALAEKHSVNMPISRDVFSVIQGEKTAIQAFRGLTARKVGAESEAG